MGLERRGHLGQIDEGTVITISDTAFHDVTGYSDGDGVNGAFVFQNGNEMKCVVAGEYMVFHGMSVSCSVGNQELSGCIAVNGAPVTLTTGREATQSSGEPIDISGRYIVPLVKDDIITHQIKNAQANDVTILQASIVLI